MRSHLRTGRNLRRTTRCSKSPPRSASCDLVSWLTPQKKWGRFPDGEPSKVLSVPRRCRQNHRARNSSARAWSPTGGSRADSVVLLFLLIKGVRRDKEALLWFWCLSVCLQQLLRSLWRDSWTFSRNQQSPWFVVWEQSANYQLLTWDGKKKSS